MKNILNSTKNIRNLFAYFITFFLVWIIRVIYIGPYFIEKFNDNIYVYTFLTEGIRILLFIVPLFLFLKHVDGVKPISFLKLNVQIVKNTKKVYLSDSYV